MHLAIDALAMGGAPMKRIDPHAETAMLEVDLNDPDSNIVRSITQHFTPFGIVKSVKVLREPTPFALIEMAMREQTYEIAAQYGGSAFGTSALVHLEQKALEGVT